MTHRVEDVINFIKKLNREEFYGNVTIKFHQGRIAHIEKQEVIRCNNGTNPDKKPK